MLLKPTRYYATDYNERGELLIMSTLNKKYLKFSAENSEKILACLKCEQAIDYDEKTMPSYVRTLYNNGFLYENKYDESKFVDVMHKTHLFSDNWLYLTILPTNNCNFRCVYCYETSTDEYMDDQTEASIKERAYKNIICNSVENKKTMVLQKVIAFPFNKEIHSLARYKKKTNFQIRGFYDIKYIGNVGRKAGEIVGCSDDTIIKNYTDIDWDDDFDTVILGHQKELSNLVNIDFMSYFIEHAIQYKKQIVSFDIIAPHFAERLEKNKIRYNYPAVLKRDVPENYFNKLRKIGKPTIAIVGTGPRQGKFTLQMLLKSIFEDSDYSVGMLGTEPTGMLLGCDEVYPMGYSSSVEVKGVDAIKVVNQMMGRIEDKEPDLIIVGSQSQSVPYSDGAIKYLPLAQHEFLLATAPDVYVLCINLSDNVDYIKRTILYLESLYGAKVLALAALPFDHAQKWSVISNKKIKLSNDEIRNRVDKIKQETLLDVFIISDELDVVNLAERIVDFFS